MNRNFLHHHNTFSSIVQKRENQKKINQEEEIEENEVESQEMLLELINQGEISEALNEFIYKENLDKNNPKVSLSFLDEEILKTKYNSKHSLDNFFKKTHKFEEMKRKGKLNDATSTLAYINSCKKENLVPIATYLIKREGNENELNLNNYYLGDSYARALSTSMKYKDNLKEIHLKGNRLTPQGIIPFLKTVKENYNLYNKIEVLDLSFNKLSDEGLRKLCEFINDPSCELKELNLEGNCLGDGLISLLCDSISQYISDKIQVLNLGKNFVSRKGALSIASLIQNCYGLNVLILCWNDIKNFEAAQIINKLRKHEQMRVLDLSFNSIGNHLQMSGESLYSQEKQKNNPKVLDKIDNNKKENKKTDKNEKVEVTMSNKELFDIVNKYNPPKRVISSQDKNSNKKQDCSEFSRELGEYFKETSLNLIHMDISHNNINYNDCLNISCEVNNNHSIIGLHVDGNEMIIDGMGFIKPIKKEFKDDKFFANSQIMYKMERDHFIKSKINNVRSIRGKNNCWICEGWKETEFILKPSKELKEKFENKLVDVKLHLDFEDWKGYEMTSRFDYYILFRMCPPGETLYFFSINNQFVEFPSVRIEHIIDLKESFEYEFSNQEKTLINRVCKKSIEFCSTNVDSNFINHLKHCIPRYEKKLKEIIKPQTPWSYSISLWSYSDYLFDGETEDFIDEVFEHDFSRINKNRDGKLEENVIECRHVLRKHYRKILDCYRYLSSILGSNVWQISQNVLTEFANNCPDLLDEDYNINFLLLQETTVKAFDKGKKYKYLPDNLVRHQFMNLLIKISKDKYVLPKITNSTEEALSISMEKHFLPVMNDYDTHKWRIERYYNENVDNFLKAFLPVLDAIFKSWAPLKDPGKRVTWMELKEFNQLVLEAVDKDFSIRDIPIIFNSSIRLQINEIDYDRHFNMFFSEFLEAFCRIIDRSSPFPEGENEEEWPLQKRQEQHLSIKLENIVGKLTKLITNSDFRMIKEKFPLPKKDDETGLYKFDPSSQFYQNYQKYFSKVVKK